MTSSKTQPINSFTVDADNRITHVIADSSGALNESSLALFTGPQLVALYNANAARVGKPTTQRFADQATGVKRVWALVDAIVAQESLKVRDTITRQKPLPVEKATGGAGSVVEKFAKAKANPAPPRGKGVHSPAGETAEPLREGSKQLKLAQLLENGATMKRLMHALNWNEATVRSGFYWDLRRKGYGVVQQGETFHLVFPAGVSTIEVTPLKKRG